MIKQFSDREYKNKSLVRKDGNLTCRTFFCSKKINNLSERRKLLSKLYTIDQNEDNIKISTRNRYMINIYQRGYDS